MQHTIPSRSLLSDQSGWHQTADGHLETTSETVDCGATMQVNREISKN